MIDVSMIKKCFYLKAVLMFLVILGLSSNSNAYGAEKYTLSAQVFHLGEMIAQPVLDVVAGETIGVDYSAPGVSRYRFVVLVRPVNDEMVSVSMQFSSGKINIQPNLLVDIGRERTAVVDKVLLKLVVGEIIEPLQPVLVAP